MNFIRFYISHKIFSTKHITIEVPVPIHKVNLDPHLQYLIGLMA